MFKPEEAWNLFRSQAVKAIEKGMLWSNDFGKTYYSISETSKDYVVIKEMDNPRFSTTLISKEATRAAEELSKKGEIEVGKLFDDEKKESLFVLLHPHLRISNNEKYIKIRKRFRNKPS